ncbi:Polygalacturonase [Posidoniimonas corsicana]|uniref:Polygalacturonase n=1 Tax=Posidoniimonas corsicana TaxID=1938618 RepID=A0A5C5UUT9_9BACT|nr:glycoside hydrolase family 28 protein [Posidoniimonas corsicana]TWT29383.1 Polygalacturonase [Posidoniimonas corsicana]
MAYQSINRLFTCLLLLAACAPALADSPWDQLPALLEKIQPPTFADKDFPITAHGAKPGGKCDCRAAIADAITACNQAGGGRVVVPAGEWFVKGPVHLLSNVNLHLEKDATLLFSNDPEDFLPMVLTRFEGTELMNFSPPIWALDQENIAVTGQGTIDGQADDKSWWKWKGNGTDDGNDLIDMADRNVPVAERRFGSGRKMRVNFVQPYRCKNLLIEGITVHRSPMWCLNPVLCQNVTVRGVRVESHGPNNDGCNPESCDGVLIEECFFNTGDDCIAIKSGRNADGRRLATPSQNIVVRNCTMRDGHGGVVLGSEMSGGIENIFVENCQMDSPNLERAIRLKSNSRRGGYLRNMYVRDIEVGEVSDAVLRINLRYFNEEGDYFPKVSNILLERVVSKKSKRPLHLMGLPETLIEDVVLRDCDFRGAKKPSLIRDVANLTLENVQMGDE